MRRARYAVQPAVARAPAVSQSPGLSAGAGEGNRTLVVSLEGFCSTIELHPRSLERLAQCHCRLMRVNRVGLTRGKRLHSR